MGRRSRTSQRETELVAVVDLGSTAVRFLLARIVPDSGAEVLVEERVPTRLGSGAPGVLPRDAVDKTRRAVHRFFARNSLNGRGPRIIAVATSAVREARNRERLLEPLRRHGLEEAPWSQRIVEAALESLTFRNGIVADLGGASLQLSRVRNRKVVSTASLPLGAVRTTSRFLSDNRPKPRALRALRTEVRERLQGVLPPAGPDEMIVGLGGTVRTLASIHLRGAHRGERKHRHGLHLAQSDITAIRERLESLSQRKRRKIRGLKVERADIILAGAIVIEELMIFGGYLTLVVCTRGVRDGILLRETFNGRG